MITEVGTATLVSTTIKDTSGTAVNTPTVVLTVTKPDGTTSTPSVTNTGASGLYTATVTPDAAGTWLLKWVASGTVVSVQSDQFSVVASQRVLVASLAELKQHENRTDTTDDNELRTFLYSATDWVEFYINGPVAPTTFTETRTVRSSLLVPNHRPLISVTSITPYQQSALDTTAYTVDTNASVIRLRSWPIYESEYTIVYRAGLTVIPERVKLAGLIVAAHLWQTQNNRAPRPGFQSEDTAMTGLGFAVPRRAMDLLAPDLVPMVG